MNDTKELRFAELVLTPCGNVYGVAPCTASIGVTGNNKCYNSPRTCQDVTNFAEGAEQVIRWAIPTSDLPLDVEAMPCITGISRRPQEVDSGESLGVRESVTVSMHNFLHNDAGFDPYLDDRSWNTYNRGTYWGKFSARWGSLEGLEFRTVDGYEGQNIDSMVRRYYVVDSSAGPDANGLFSITAKDVIKFSDGDKAQWPAPSTGKLLAEITDIETTLTLTPSGIGDIEYPASGTASIGDEKVTFTRTADVVTLTGRGLSGSELDGHKEGETFQLAAVYVGQDPAALFRDIITDATDIPAEYLDYDTWKTEVDNYLGRLYSAEIMQPTSVKTLLEEITREAGLTVFTDLVNKKIALKVLRQEVPTTAVTDDVIVAGTIASKKLTSKRVSDVWVYYGKKNPLEKQSEQKNFNAIYAKITENPVVALENSPSAIREIASRWITTENGDAAISVADRIIARFENIPRKVSLKIPNSYPLSLGSQFTVQSRIFEDELGDLEDAINCQVVQLENSGGVYTAIGEEVIFGEIDPPEPNLRNITINADVLTLNLREAHDSIYTPIETGQTVRLIISSAAIVGSLVIGDWDAGVIVEIDGTGRVQGSGGSSGGGDGGTALYTRYPVEIIGDLEIWGGGGGGGDGNSQFGESDPGGGGAGFPPAEPGGTTERGGDTALGDGGDGGDPGEAGSDGEDKSDPENPALENGGDAGSAIDGISYVTITGTLDIRGPQVN